MQGQQKPPTINLETFKNLYITENKAISEFAADIVKYAIEKQKAANTAQTEQLGPG